MTDPRSADGIVPWLIGLSILGGAALGSAYVAIWVLPPLAAYYETRSFSDYPGGFIAFYFIVAAIVGAFAGSISGVVVVVVRSLFMRLSGSAAVEVVGVSLGAVLSVALSYLVLMFDPRMKPAHYLLLYCTIASLGLGGFTLLYAGKFRQGRPRKGNPSD